MTVKPSGDAARRHYMASTMTLNKNKINSPAQSGLLSNLGNYLHSKDFANLGKGLTGLANIGLGIGQSFLGLQNYRLAKKQLGLAREQFAFEKGLANRNIANQAKLINTQYDNAAQVAAGMMGSGGMTNQAIVDRYAQKAKEQYVDASPIG